MRNGRHLDEQVRMGQLAYCHSRASRTGRCVEDLSVLVAVLGEVSHIDEERGDGYQILETSARSSQYPADVADDLPGLNPDITSAAAGLGWSSGDRPIASTRAST
jgi:hypothetical protein